MNIKYVHLCMSVCLSVLSCHYRYGVAKGDIMDANSERGGELAVRLAIGETQIIQENKSFFASHGIDLDALESLTTTTKPNATISIANKKNNSSNPIDRSKTILLVKNLPHNVIEGELENMFSK